MQNEGVPLGCRSGGPIGLRLTGWRRRGCGLWRPQCLALGVCGAGPLSFSEVFSENGHLSGICAGQRSSRKQRGGSRNSGFDGNVLEVFSTESLAVKNVTLSTCDTHKIGRLKSLSASGFASGTIGCAGGSVLACEVDGGEGRRRFEQPGTIRG
jgi:hypothetical protein